MAGAALPRDDALTVECGARHPASVRMQARSLLGRACMEGHRLPRDVPPGLALLQATVQAGDSTGQAYLSGLYPLGGLCENSLGISRYKAEAVEWYTRAANKGNAEAKKALERLK